MLWFAAIRPGTQKRSSRSGPSNWKISAVAEIFWATTPSCWTANILASTQIVQIPYQVSLVFNTFTDILLCSSSSPMKIGIKYSAFRGLPGTSFSKNSLKPSSNTSKNSGVNPHMFMETREFSCFPSFPHNFWKRCVNFVSQGSKVQHYV